MDSQILTALMTCPRYADFRFNHNLQSIKGKSNSIECGSILHKFLETYFLCLIKGVKKEDAVNFAFTAAELYIKGCPDCTDFVPHDCPECKGEGQFRVHDGSEEGHIEECKACDRGQVKKPKCGHKVDDYPGVKNTPADSEKWKTGWKWVLETCQQYIDYYRNDHWVPLEVEVVKSKVIYEDDEIRIMWKAKLDLLADTNQGIYPVDHKSMKQRRDTVSLNNQFIGQCIIADTRSVIINKIGFQTSLKPEEKFSRAVLSYSAPRLFEWISEIVPYYAYQLLTYAESGYFPPNFSNCETKYGPCAYQEVCASNPDMREDELKRLFIVGPEWNPTNESETD